ncbi:prolyl oligopeptidase family serine peptidase [Nonomuraea sp. NPDC049504]|uniref:S9 family peptidase n=1 Tax=Nonomuraea sp. NPDC049504 TaxID=3154729 RepID=UPI0034350193
MLTEELVVDARLPVGPAISPDGRRVAYGEMPGRTIWVVDVDGDAPPRELGQGIDPKWSPDSRYVYFRTEGQLHREPVEGGGRRSWSGEAAAYLPLADHHTVAVLSPDPDESDPWVWSEAAGRHRLRLLDVRSGEVYTPEVFQGRHAAEVAERPGGGMLAVLTQESPDPGDLMPRLHLFDPATGETRELGACAVPAGSLTWWEAVDGWHVAYVATTPPGPVGGNAVLDVALTDGKHRNLTEGLPFCPLTLTSGGLVLVADGLDAAIHRLDPVTRRLVELLRLTGQAFWLTADADGATVAVARSEAYEPRSVFAGPVQGPLVRRTDTAPELRAIEWGAQERLSYRGHDGLDLDGLLVLPPGKSRDDGPFSLVTFAHGGPYGRWADQLLLQHHEPAQWLAGDGHAVFLPNPRGGQGHGHAFAANGTVGREEWQDVITGIDLLIERGIAAPDRLGIGGYSHGGYLAAWAVGQTDRFKAALVGAGISDWGMLAATGEFGPFEAALGGSHGWEGRGPHPHDERSPISYASRIRTPVLIVHGAQDTNVPLGQAEFLHRALRRFGVEHEFVVYPREGHAIAERNHRIDLLRRTRSWFRRLR